MTLIDAPTAEPEIFTQAAPDLLSRRQLVTRRLTPPAALVGLAAGCDLTAGDATRGTHVLRRLTFGPTTDELAHFNAVGETAWLEDQMNPDSIDTSAVDAMLEPLDSLSQDAGVLRERFQDEDRRRGMGADLRVAAFVRHLASPAQLHERMVDFWGDHFNAPQVSQVSTLLKVVEDREVIRALAFTSFEELLIGSAQSPAMLIYLDNARSFDGQMNENYARELMELHTLGVNGGYDEDDIISVAKLLTGWTVDFRGTLGFRFAERRHDSDAVSILGWDRPTSGGPLSHGEDFLRYLAMHPSTAAHVCAKLARRFVTDVPDPALVDAMVATWLAEGSQIKPVLRTMVGHPSFGSAVNAKFHRPWDYLLHALRASGASVDVSTERRTVGRFGQALENLGQVPFAWPAPNGFPDVEPAWLNAGGMLNRWNLVADALAGRFPFISIDARATLADLSGKPRTAIYEDVAKLLRFETLTGDGAKVLDLATGWQSETRPSDSQIATALPKIATVLLTSPDAQYR